MPILLIALLSLGQTGEAKWATFNCDGGVCTFNITTGVQTIDETTEPLWNNIPVLCMELSGPRLSSEGDPKAERPFYPVCYQFDYDNDRDLDLRDFAELQRTIP